MYDAQLHQSKKIPQDTLVINGRDEMNLAEFPFSKLGCRDTRNEIVCEVWATDSVTGSRYCQIWEARTASKKGLPNELADRVYVALLSLSTEQNLERKVTFSIYRLLKILGMSIGSRNYKHVEDALEQLAGVTIFSNQAFWDKEQNKRITTKNAFHLIDDYQLRSEKSGSGHFKEQGYVIWGNRLWNSINSGYIKYLDTNFYFSLGTPLSRRLYRLLDKMLYMKESCEIDIFDLASRLGMARYKYPSKLASKLRPAFDELVSSGYLHSAELVKVSFSGKKYSRIKFIKNTYGFQLSLELESPLSSTVDAQNGDITVEVEQQAVVEIVTEYSPLWDEVLLDLKAQMNKDAYSTFMRTSTLLSIEDSQATIKLENGAALGWVNNRLSSSIKNSLNISLRSAGMDTVSSVEFVS